MPDRYFVESPIQGDRACLLGPEAHHLAHVMRAAVGAEVVLFDGSGAEFVARVERLGRPDTELAIVSRHAIDRQPALSLTLAVALPKGDRRRWLVEKAVELGVARLVPLISQRTDPREQSTGSDRLQRAVIEASKQCGRNRLMEIAAPARLSELLTTTSREAERWIAQPGGEKLSAVFDGWLASGSMPAQLALAVGPEGGFDRAEVESATAAGWKTVGLGQRVLRIETAALALCAAVMLRCES